MKRRRCYTLFSSRKKEYLIMTTTRNKTYDMICVAMFAVIMAVCSWISIPTLVPFTMQTFALFLAFGVLGGKRGTLVVVIYVLLGAVGVPVFAGFSSGLGVLMGTTGGYVLGFLLSGLLYWSLERLLGEKIWVRALSMVLGMVTYYVFGTIWFMVVYTQNTGAIGLSAVLGWCVFPFLLPDSIKMVLALILSDRLKKIVKKSGWE